MSSSDGGLKSNFSSQVKSEVIRINTAVQRSKISRSLGEKIAEKLLKPILLEMTARADVIANDLGQMIKDALVHNIMNSTPSGREYQVIRVDWSAPKGEGGRYELIGTYTASAAGEPPAHEQSGLGVPTGTLIDSIDYEITGDGRVRVGIFDSKGTEATTAFFRGKNKIFISEDGSGRQGNVLEYSSALDDGFNNKITGTSVSPRPWYFEEMEKLRDKIHETVQREMHEAIRSAVRSGGFKVGSNDFYFRVFFEKKWRD